MKSVCLIPARGGSKRIPRKNIKSFFGKPLISWSIETAISSGIFDEVYVSTDDEEIASISKHYGANVPFIRPENLSNDFAIDKDVIKHFIEWMESTKLFPDSLCYLYATAPFINEKTILGVQKLLKDSGAGLAHTVTSYDYPVFKALKEEKNGQIEYMWKEFANTRSQDLPELIHDAGQCYFYNLKKFKDEEYRTVGYKIPRTQAQDIDTLEDFNQAEILFDLYLKNQY